jgi:hypothetical protein
MLLVKAFDTTRTSMVIRLSSTSLVPRSSPGCRPSVDRVRLRVAPLIMRPTPAATTPGDFKPGDRDRPHEKRRAHHRCNLGQGIRRSGRQPRYVSLVEAGGFADVAPVLGGAKLSAKVASSSVAVALSIDSPWPGASTRGLSEAISLTERSAASQSGSRASLGGRSSACGAACPKTSRRPRWPGRHPAESTRPSGRNRQTWPGVCPGV